MRRFYGIFFPALGGAIPTLVLFLMSGVIVYLSGILPLIFLFGIIFLPMGILIGRAFPEQSWKSGIWLSVTYSIWLVFILINIFSFNFENQGIFVRTEFFPVAAFLYLSPVMIACVSAYAGSDFSRKSISLLVTSVVLTFVAVIYVSYNSISSTDKNTFSFDLIENTDVHLKAEITCESITGKQYMRFFNTDRTDCSYSKIFVLKKPSDFSLPQTLSVTTDGVEESHPIWPQLDSTGDVFGIDASKKQDLDNTKIWGSGSIPWRKVVRSQQVNFKWGKISFDFGESEFNDLRKTLGKYGD